MSTVSTYEDFAQWRGPRPAATVGDAMREFTGTPIDVLVVWFARHDRGTDTAQRVASQLAAASRLPGMDSYLTRHAGGPSEQETRS